MALINSNNQYIKLGAEGAFEIYATEADRIRVKTATPAEIILQKYVEIISDLQSSKYDEMRYYDRVTWGRLFDSWIQEAQRYDTNLRQHLTTEEYPLMAEYYSDVADSIPNIIMSGSMGPCLETVEEVYQEAKHYKTWGETTDA